VAGERRRRYLRLSYVGHGSAHKTPSDGTSPSARADALKAFSTKVDDLLGASQPGFFGVPPGGKRPENYSTIHQHFAGLLTVADSADAAPTTQAATLFKELQAALQVLNTRWQRLKTTDLATLNTALKGDGLAPIDAKKLGKGTPSDDSDGDDEP
jgi:hypothetical protein